MKYFVVKLKEKFSFLKSQQEPELHCYINETTPKMKSGIGIPAMLIAPGGGYVAVSERESDPIAFKYLAAGFSCFVLKYSIKPEHYPQQLLEIALAMLYIRKHAEEWHIDSNKIAVNGYSAGGHLAASLGVLWNDESILSFLNVKGDEIRPNAMVLSYPVISADASFSHKPSIDNVSGTTDTESEIYKKMSLEKHVNAETPPTFIWHTASDLGVPAKNSLVFATKLAENNVTYELHIYPYGSHGLSTCDYASNTFNQKQYAASWMDESIKFLFELWFKNDN